MKKTLFILALALGCATITNADVCQQANYHETGVVTVKNGQVALRVYSALPQTAENGKTYYRWYDCPGHADFLPEALDNQVGKDGEAASDSLQNREPLKLWQPGDVLTWQSDSAFAAKSPKALASTAALTLGYRFADGKMFVYDFETEKETLALDFTLQPGQRFTTPDGTEWEVIKREQREFKTLRGQNNAVDYQAVHTVLTVRSADGTKTDEWIENLGAVRYTLMLEADDTELAHVAYIGYGQEGPYLTLDFDEAPLFGRYINYAEPLVDEPTEGQAIENSADGTKITLYRYGSYQTRFYCYAYNDGRDISLGARELGPYRDEQTLSRFQFTIGSARPDNTFTPGDLSGLAPINPPQPVAPAIYDLQGRRLKAEPKHGISIKNGRKVVCR